MSSPRWLVVEAVALVVAVHQFVTVELTALVVSFIAAGVAVAALILARRVEKSLTGTIEQQTSVADDLLTTAERIDSRLKETGD